MSVHLYNQRVLNAIHQYYRELMEVECVLERTPALDAHTDRKRIAICNKWGVSNLGRHTHMYECELDDYGMGKNQVARRGYYVHHRDEDSTWYLSDPDGCEWAYSRADGHAFATPEEAGSAAGKANENLIRRTEPSGYCQISYYSPYIGTHHYADGVVDQWADKAIADIERDLGEDLSNYR
jgi:hypothetical protein